MDMVHDRIAIASITSVAESDTTRFDRIFSVCQDAMYHNVSAPYQHVSLADGHYDGVGGGSTEYKDFARAAHMVLKSVRGGETILVHCHAGQSRSVAVVVAALGVYTERTYNDVLYEIEQSRPQANPGQLMAEHAQQFIREEAGISPHRPMGDE